MSRASHRLPSDQFADPSQPGLTNSSALSQSHFRCITATSGQNIEMSHPHPHSYSMFTIHTFICILQICMKTSILSFLLTICDLIKGQRHSYFCLQNNNLVCNIKIVTLSNVMQMISTIIFRGFHATIINVKETL